MAKWYFTFVLVIFQIQTASAQVIPEFNWGCLMYSQDIRVCDTIQVRACGGLRCNNPGVHLASPGVECELDPTPNFLITKEDYHDEAPWITDAVPYGSGQDIIGWNGYECALEGVCECVLQADGELRCIMNQDPLACRLITSAHPVLGGMTCDEAWFLLGWF